MADITTKLSACKSVLGVEGFEIVSHLYTSGILVTRGNPGIYITEEVEGDDVVLTALICSPKIEIGKMDVAESFVSALNKCIETIKLLKEKGLVR